MELLTDDAAGLRRAAHLLSRGCVVAFPTDTVYGLAALASDRTAVERIYRIKGRARDKPLVLMVEDVSGVDEWAELSPAAASLAARWWPGPLTLVLKARAAVAPWLVAGDPPLIGVRVPDHAGARGLLAEVGEALATTSANASGRRAALTGAEAGALAGVAAVVDGGPAPGGIPSTVCDVSGPQPRVLREGALPVASLLAG